MNLDERALEIRQTILLTGISIFNVACSPKGEITELMAAKLSTIHFAVVAD
jgi:hypothetical protein